jgi:GNAT superfamily N-acetyltransferase
MLWLVVVVRRAVTADWEQSRLIRLHALRDAPLVFASTYEREVQLAPAQWQQWITTSAQFLAEVDGAVVGTATGVVDAGDPTTMLLVAMFVMPSSRGRGVGEQLVEAVVEQARVEGARRIRLHVVETNSGGERLYPRCGFARTGATMRLPHQPELIEREMVLALV